MGASINQLLYLHKDNKGLLAVSALYLDKNNFEIYWERGADANSEKEGKELKTAYYILRV